MLIGLATDKGYERDFIKNSYDTDLRRRLRTISSCVIVSHCVGTGNVYVHITTDDQLGGI